MFCPNCGKADQQSESYCRHCGIFLPDLSKPVKRSTPEEHLKVNMVLSGMTIATCFVLAVLLYVVLAFRPWTHPLIYVTAGLLTAMGIWHTQTLWRTVLLRRHFKRKGPGELDGVDAEKLLDRPAFESMVPPSVADRTTRELEESKLRSS